jgi:ABC-type sulfate transport system permease component
MSLNDVSVQASVHHHAALKIHQVARLQQAEVAAVESLLYGSHGICTVAREVDNREAYAVVGYRLVDFQFVGKRAFERYVDVPAVLLYCGNLGRRFYYS